MKRVANAGTFAPVAVVATMVATGLATAACGVGDSSEEPLRPRIEAGTPTGTPADLSGFGAGDGNSGTGGGGGGSGDNGSGGDTGGGTGPGPPGSDGGNNPAPDPTGGGATEAPDGAADLEQVLLLPVDLVAPTECFTKGLSERYVDGYGAQVIDPRPHGDLVATRVEYDGLTRIPMDSSERRVHLLPGSSRPVAAPAGNWSVAVDVHMYLSGGFQLNYTRTHHAGGTGQFHQTFASPVDDTCTVEIVYGITTSAVS